MQDLYNAPTGQVECIENNRWIKRFRWFTLSMLKRANENDYSFSKKKILLIILKDITLIYYLDLCCYFRSLGSASARDWAFFVDFVSVSVSSFVSDFHSINHG